MVWLKRMLTSGFVAIAVLLATSVAASSAFANTVSDKELRDGSRRANAQTLLLLRKQREAQRAQRLSPEERRQLRRDIKDAGREIYPVRR